MKLYYLFSLFILSLSLHAQEISYDSAADNLHGKVKEIDYKNFKFRSSTGEKELKYFNRYRFDKSGNLVEKIKFGYDNKPDTKALYKYNDGHLISIIEQKTTGKNDKVTHYYYDTKGKPKKVIKKNQRGDVEYEIIYTYDNQDRIIKKEKKIPNISYSMVETFVYHSKHPKPYVKNKKTRIGTSKETYEYDAKNRLIKKSEYNAIGELFSYIQYAYDKEGNKISLDKFDEKGKKTYSETYEYQYDSHHNWTKKITYKKGKKDSVEIRKITYY